MLAGCWTRLRRAMVFNSYVTTKEVRWKDLATVCTEGTGKKAAYKPITLNEYFNLGILGDRGPKSDTWPSMLIPPFHDSTKLLGLLQYLER